VIPAAPPPHSITRVDVWGQPSRSAEVAGRPLGSTLHVFAGGKTVVVPSWHGDTMSNVATRMHAGALVVTKARHIGSLYVVPTSTGWACVQGAHFLTCHRGLLRQGVTYGFQSSATGIAVYGLAADGVKSVSLGSHTATVHDNVFFLTRTVKLSPLPKTFGTLVVTYRDGRAPARVTLR
jgi:hypothetical protein